MGNDAITSLRLVPSLEVATKEYLPVEVDPVIEQILELPGVIAVLDVSGNDPFPSPWAISNHTEFLDIYVSNLGDFVQTKTSLSTAGKIVKWSDREMELTLELWETSVSATEIVNSACLIHCAKPYVLERGESRDRVLTPSSFALTSESLGQLLTLHYSPEAASSVIWELSNFDETGTGVMSAEKLRAEIFSHITTAVNRVCGDLGCHKKQWTEAELVHPVEQMKLLRWEPLEYFLFESSLANQDPSPMSDGESDVMDDLSLWFHDYVHLHRESLDNSPHLWCSLGRRPTPQNFRRRWGLAEPWQRRLPQNSLPVQIR